VEGEADQLIAAANDLLVAEAAGHRQGQLIVFGPSPSALPRG